jgi:hypothetical protein
VLDTQADQLTKPEPGIAAEQYRHPETGVDGVGYPPDVRFDETGTLVGLSLISAGLNTSRPVRLAREPNA